MDGPSVRPAATEAVVTRVRTALEASRAYVFGHGIALQPSLELGLRRDGGDAETGADDGYTDLPPKAVPPTVLVQRPPEAWGEGR